MSITFTDKREAKEYQKQMLADGIETYVLTNDNKYIVKVLGKVTSSKIAFERVPIDWMEDKTSKGEHGDEDYYTGEYGGMHTAFYTKRASAREKLHELGHAKLGHKSTDITKKVDLSYVARKEIEADIYSFDKMDRPITKKVGINAYRVLTEDYNVELDKAARIIQEELTNKGVNLTIEEIKMLPYRE